MHRLLIALPLMLAAGLALASANDDFTQLADRYVADLPNFSPINATLIGDHSADGQLDQADAKERKRARDLYQQYLDRLDVIDRDALSRANQVDSELLRRELEANIWNVDVLREWQWNPLVFVNFAGSAIYGLLARDFATKQERLTNVASRLEQLPRFFAQARTSIKPELVPKIHAETAVKQNPGLSSIIDEMLVPQMAGIPDDLKARLNAAIEIARDAIAKQQSWLENDVLPVAAGNFRIGEKLFDQKLAFALDSPLSRKEIRSLAEREYEAVRNEMYDTAKVVYGKANPHTTFPDTPDEAYKQAIIRAALEQAYQHLPPRDGIVEVAKQDLKQASDFVVEHNIVTMPDNPVEVIVMPEFQRGVSVAYLDPPGPLDKGQKAMYAVAPLPTSWSDDQVQSFLREYNLYSIQDLTIHEGMPGHYLQLSLSNRYPSTLRSVLWSGSFVEGWAVYAERMMIDEGYMNHDPLLRLSNLKWYLRAVTNAILDSAIHVDNMSQDAAMKLMVEGAFQEESEAAGKWVRAQLTSAQLSTYFVGYQEHVAMRKAVEAAWGDKFTLRRYHDQALSYGSPPVKYVRALMLDQPIPHALQ